MLMKWIRKSYYIILLFVILIAWVVFYKDNSSSDVNNQQSDIEKIRSVLIAHRQQHNRLPTYEEITAPHPNNNLNRNIFSYDKESLSFYNEANIKNNLKEGSLESGQSYYAPDSKVTFDQNHPLPNLNNFHIVTGYKCSGPTLQKYNLTKAGHHEFAIIYYTNSSENIYRCLDG